MGNSVSQEEIDQVGYRVLGVQPNSPASNCGLVSFFDFIITANGIPLKALDTTFIDVIKASEDITLTLTIYNTKSNTTREVNYTHEYICMFALYSYTLYYVIHIIYLSFYFLFLKLF
jgi:C-terminal processing protease CtpA/Prc